MTPRTPVAVPPGDLYLWEKVVARVTGWTRMRRYETRAICYWVRYWKHGR